VIDNSLSERDQAIEFSSRFPETPAVEAVHHPGGLLDHMAGHVLEFSDRLFPAFSSCFIPAVPIRFRNFTRDVASRI
jgi:hypothetical protein